MKKFALLLIFSATAALHSWSHEFTYTYHGHTITYEAYPGTSGGCYVKGCDNPVGDVEIPEKAWDGENYYTVTAIGMDAFGNCNSLDNCPDLLSVTLPNTIKVIGESAFYGCCALRELKIPDSVDYLEACFCYGCAKLTSVTIGNSVPEIPMQAFYGCSALETVELGNGIRTIDEMAFFECTSLKSIEIPSSVNAIGNRAFYRCQSLQSIDIPSSVYSLGEDVFAVCDALTSVTIPESITEIPSGAFMHCSKLSSVTMGNSVRTIGNNSFAMCTSLTAIDIPPYVITIGRGAFAQCSSLIAITIPESVHYIGGGAFSNCLGLTKAEYASIEHLCSISFDGENANPLQVCGHLYIDGVLITDPVIPSSVSSIQDYAFAGGQDIKSVTLPDNLSYIGSYAFQKCKLTSITIPSEAYSIGINAFGGCPLIAVQSLIAAPKGSLVDYFDSGTYNRATLYVPKGLVDTYKQTDPWSKFTYVTEIGGESPNLFTYTHNGHTVSYTVIDAVAKTCMTTEESHEYYSNYVSGDVEIPEYAYNNGVKYTVVAIGDCSFASNDQLTSITLPSSVSALGEGAFYDCCALEAVHLSESIITIGESAFDNCQALKNINIPNSLQSIPGYAFNECTALKSIIIPNSVEEINECAFNYCLNLDEIIMGYGIISIGDNSFSDVSASAVYCTAAIAPEMDADAFTNYSGTLYVTPGAVESYKSTAPWSQFANLEVMTEATDLTLNTTNISGQVGDTFRLTASVQPYDVTLPYVVWRSTNPAIATVDCEGLVTIVGDAPQIQTCADGDDNACRIIAETLYADGPVAVVTVGESVSAIDDVEADGVESIDYSKPYDVYDAQGVRIATSTCGLAPGLYIIRQGTRSVKIVL